MPTPPISTTSPRLQPLPGLPQDSAPRAPTGTTPTTPGGAAAGMAGLPGRPSRQASPHRAGIASAAPRVAIPGRAAPPQDLRGSENFLVGIKPAPGKAAGFQQAAQGGHHAQMRYIAENVNPNLLYGSLLNIGKAAIGSGPSALKQNCVYCSKAADQNLDALAAGGIPQHFWIADKTSAGQLPQEGSLDHGLKSGDRISQLLQADIPRGRRAVISVPQRDTPAYSHAMNFVHADDGSRHVIDGQNSKVYDLSHEPDRKAFDDKFGHNGGPCVARFFATGAAPHAASGSDHEDWVDVS